MLTSVLNKKIKDLFRIKWITRLEALYILCSLQLVAVKRMQMILNNCASWSAENVADAKLLFSAATSPEFLAAFMEQAEVMQKLTTVVDLHKAHCLIQRTFGANFTAGTSNGRQSFVHSTLANR